jgi:hypothetical protein
MPAERTVDRAYALREAGRSAAEVGELDKTRIFFEQAWEASRLCGTSMQATTAGLSADCAILDFDAGKIKSALNLMQRALVEADGLDPRAGLKESYVKRVHIAAILYMRGASKEFPAARQVMVTGMYSNPEPHEWFRTQPQPQPAFVWYQLTELEAETPDETTVLTELRKRTKGGDLLPMETMLAPRLVEAAVRNLNAYRFLGELKTYPRAVGAIPQLRASSGWDIFNQPIGHLRPIAESEWKESAVAEATKQAVLTFMLTCGARGQPQPLVDLRLKLMSTPGLFEQVDRLFHLVDDPTQDEIGPYTIIPSIIGRLLRRDVFDANDAFLAAVYVVQFFAR